MSDVYRFSQNFLHNPRLVGTLLDATNITSNDIVYDIGGGKGIIATALAPRCRQVVSVEVDPRMAALLRERVGKFQNVRVVEADFLHLALPDSDYKVFANIPFNLSADIVHTLCGASLPPRSSYLIVQKEFARKLVSHSGGKTTQMAVLLGVRFQIRIIKQLLASDFYPRPKIVPVFLEITRRSEPLVSPSDITLFTDFVTYGFNSFKPTLQQALLPLISARQFEQLATRLDFSPDVIPSQLTLEIWVHLFTALGASRSALEHVIGGYASMLAQKHANRVKVHRTHKDRA